MPPTNKAGVIEAGSAALRKVMSGPLKLRKSKDDKDASDHARPELGQDAVNTIIESEIIPRLLMAHSDGPSAVSSDRKTEIAPSEANRFARMPLDVEVAGLIEEVDKFLAEGVSVDAIYIDLLAPTARRLGEMWETDECDFVDVTMGLWRLQEVMRDIAARSPNVIGSITAPNRILVSAMPGDQHTFGAQMIDEIFARAGWQSELMPSAERRKLLNKLSTDAFDVAALTITRDCPSGAIASLIKAMRGVSVNSHLSILIGGNAVNNNPALVAEVGADGTGSDARSALEAADRMVAAAPLQAYEMR